MKKILLSLAMANLFSCCFLASSNAQSKENCSMQISYPIDHKQCTIIDPIFNIAMDSIGNRIKENLYKENYKYKKSMYLDLEGEKIKITYLGSNSYLDSRQMIEMVRENDLLAFRVKNNNYVIYKYLNQPWDSELYTKYLEITDKITYVNYVDNYRMINGRDYYSPPVIVDQEIVFYLYPDRVEFVKDEITEIDMYREAAGW